MYCECILRWVVSKFSKVVYKNEHDVQSAISIGQVTKKLYFAYYFICHFIYSAYSDVPELYEPQFCLCKAWILFEKVVLPTNNLFCSQLISV